MKQKLFLFLGVIGAVALMTSCLGDTSYKYTDKTFVYLSRDDLGTVYGKSFMSLNPHVISNNEMQEMNSGVFKFMYFAFDEDIDVYKTITLDGTPYSVEIVRFLDNPGEDVKNVSLNINQAMEDKESENFESFGLINYSHYKADFDDHWLFGYTYKSDNENAIIEFYENNEVTSSNEIVIDVFLETPETTSSKDQTGHVALNMSQLRAKYQGTSTTKTKTLKITFKYYSNNTWKSSQVCQFIVADN